MVHIILSRLGTTIISIANTCPIRAVQQLIAVGEFVGWEMKKGLPFLQYSDGSKACQAGARFTPTFSKPISLLPQSAVEAGFARRFLHALGGGGGFESFSRRRLCPPLCNARFGKPAKTAWRYMHLAQVVPPDSSRYPMVPGATEAQYKATKESPLRKHNRSWTAVGNQVREQGLTLST